MGIREKLREKLAALWATPSGVVLIFWAIILLSDLIIALFCLAIVGFLFGLEALAYFSVGILIVIGLVAAYFIIGKNFIGGLLKLIGKSR